MSDNLRMTDTMIDEYLAQLREQLKKGIVYKNTIKLPEIKKVEKTCNLFITPEAYAKMMYIVHENSKEVGWHATAERTENGFKVTDVLIYPQTVTGATVDTDPKEYSFWLQGLSNEIFASVRFHGHSHVNMGVNPSTQDEEHRREIVSKIGTDDFYIFMIFNKSCEYSIRIYDARDNVVYDKADVNVCYFNGQDELDKAMKDNVKEKSYQKSDTKLSPPLQKKAAKKSSKKEEVKDNYSFLKDDDDSFDRFLEDRYIRPDYLDYIHEDYPGNPVIEYNWGGIGRQIERK